MFFGSLEGSYSISVVEFAVFLGDTVSQIPIGQGDLEKKVEMKNSGKWVTYF